MPTTIKRYCKHRPKWNSWSLNTTDFENSKSEFGGVTAGHVNYVQELTIEVHNQTGNVFTTRLSRGTCIAT